MMASPLPLAIVILTIICLGVTGNLFSSSPIVIAIQVAAAALSIWARRSFQSGEFRVTAGPVSSTVMRRGPYRFLRHPMYSAVLIFIWAGVLSHLSTWTLAAGGVVTAVAITRVFAEERMLRARYPDYAGYAATTKALVPFVF
jgi:protein-S-isoprenylcysteine O-methyltransferase Ste14